MKSFTLISALMGCFFLGLSSPGDAQSVWQWRNPFPQGNQLNSLSYLDSSHLWAVGNHGSVAFFNGAYWRLQTSGTLEDMTSVKAVSSNNVWAVTSNGLTPPLSQGFVYHNDGTSWSDATFSPAPYGLNAIDGADASHVWAVGTSGSIYFYNGSTWASQTAPGTAWLFGLSRSEEHTSELQSH